VQSGGQVDTQAHFGYTPFPGFVGVDHFTFRVTGSALAGVEAMATVTVTLSTSPILDHLLLPLLRR
jgi:hypothetical protein